MNKKLEDMIAESKLKEILHKNEAEKRRMRLYGYLQLLVRLQESQPLHMRYSVL